MADLSTTYLGISIKNPLIIGSSGLSDNIDKIKDLEANGAGAIVLKSIFEEEIVHEYNAEIKKSLSEGTYIHDKFDYLDYHLKEENIKNYFKLIAQAKKEIKIPVIASINCNSSQEWPYFASKFEEAGADAIELNAFILPSDISKSSQENEKLYFDIISAVKDKVKIPFALKISHYFSNLARMIKELSETGIAGLILFNRFYSPDFDIKNLKLLATHVLSSADELPISLRWIAMMSGRVNCDLIASTGIHDGEAAIKQLLAGANAFQIASTLYKNGNKHIGKILEEISEWMLNMNYTKINDFKGIMSQKNISDPAMYERVQFMKYFSDRH